MLIVTEISINCGAFLFGAAYAAPNIGTTISY